MTTPGPTAGTQATTDTGTGSGAPVGGWPPYGTAWGVDDGWGDAGRPSAPGTEVARTTGASRTTEVARTTGAVGPARFAVPAARAAAPSWELPMAWLAGHLPLTLIMDLSMPFGPHSRELLVEEPPPATAS